MSDQGFLLLDTLLKGTLFLLLAAVASLLLRRASSATRAALWSAALASLLAVPALTFLLPVWEVPMPAFWGSPEEATPRLDLPLPLDALRVEDAALPLAEKPSFLTAWRTPSFWLAVWFAGSALLLLRLASGYLRAHLWTRGAEPLGSAWRELLETEKRRFDLGQTVTLTKSGRVKMPMIVGLWRAMLVLPLEAASWSSERRRLVLRHELAHVERRDCAVQLIVQLACCLHWLNPLVWLAAHRYQLERERACDDRVLSLGGRASDYANHLLEIARARSPRVLSAVAMARRSQLEGRLLAILDTGLRRGAANRVVRALAGSMMAVCVVLALVRPVAGGEPSQETPELEPVLAGPEALDDATPMLAAAQLEPPPDREYVGEPITMTLDNADLVETLRRFSKITNVNWVIDPRVSGTVTMELKEVPWDQAFELILHDANLGMIIDGTVIRIAPKAVMIEEIENNPEQRDYEYEGEPINMSLKNADLVEVLQNFGKISGLNLVIEPGVSGSVTVELRQVPWDQALEQILKINDLGMEVDGDVVHIAPR